MLLGGGADIIILFISIGNLRVHISLMMFQQSGFVHRDTTFSLASGRRLGYKIIGVHTALSKMGLHSVQSIPHYQLKREGQTGKKVGKTNICCENHLYPPFHDTKCYFLRAKRF